MPDPIDEDVPPHKSSGTNSDHILRNNRKGRVSPPARPGNGGDLPQSPTAEEREFMRAVAAGLADLDEGREVCLTDAKSELRID